MVTTAPTQGRFSKVLQLILRCLSACSLHGHWLGMGTMDLAPFLHATGRASEWPEGAQGLWERRARSSAF